MRSLVASWEKPNAFMKIEIMLGGGASIFWGHAPLDTPLELLD